MKDIIESVISEGIKSKRINDLVNFCHKIAVTTLKISKYSGFISEKSGLSISDLAYDVIADIFIVENNRYLVIDNNFSDLIREKTIKSEVITSKIYALVISRTNQKIVELREEYGELYFKIKRAVFLHISRNKNFKKFLYKSHCFIHTCNIKGLKENFLEFPEEELLEHLFARNTKKFSVSSTVNSVFEIINSQNKYAKVLSEVKLYFVISEFYKKRYESYLSDLKNVHYIDIEKEI